MIPVNAAVVGQDAIFFLFALHFDEVLLLNFAFGCRVRFGSLLRRLLVAGVGGGFEPFGLGIVTPVALFED